MQRRLALHKYLVAPLGRFLHTPRRSWKLRFLGGEEHNTPGEKDFQAGNIILACLFGEVPETQSFRKGLDNGRIASDVDGPELFTSVCWHRKTSVLSTPAGPAGERTVRRITGYPLQKIVFSVMIFLQEVSCVTLVDVGWPGCGSTGVFYCKG